MGPRQLCIRALLGASVASACLAASAAAVPPQVADVGGKAPPVSGQVEFGPGFGTGLVECPQAGEPLDKQPKPFDLASKDRAEQVATGGDDIRVNQDYACLPQNETSIAVSRAHQRNVIAGVNDYKTASQALYASTDNGQNWYETIIPPIDVPRRNVLEPGDPAMTFDRAGIAYSAAIAFDRTDDTNGIFVTRSSNGGFTWSKPCTPTAIPEDPTREGCGPLSRGARFDARKPGDGVVAFEDDLDGQPNGSVPFNDKEYIAAGPRPAGVEPMCFSSHHVAEPCNPATVGVDRLYVTWTKFTAQTAEIIFSFSDDQGRSWSPERPISGSAPFCIGGVGANACDVNQFSTPTVNPTTGFLYVAFQNFNTPDENQYLLVRSRDGGATFEGPFFVTPVFDVNYPRSGIERPDCTPRGQQTGRMVLTNNCFRVNSGGNVVVDRRGGERADDLYLVMSDNRNGTRASSNTDVFLFVSKDGGTTWIGPTRVNDDPSQQPANRNCNRPNQPACPAGVNTGNDQWFPWVDIGDDGDLNVVFYDRRLDPNSTASEWPTSRQRPGNYLTWFFGARCSFTTSDPRECVAGAAGVITQPPGPVNPGNELFPEQQLFPLRNFTVSDTPSNMDYAFQAGTFIGDYNNVAIGPDNQAFGFWTDARNGRSSRIGGPSPEPGRNPVCEQSDVFSDSWSAQSGGTVDQPKATDELFLVTPCPIESIEPGNR